MSPSKEIEVDVSNIGMSVFILASRLVSKKLKQNGIYKIFLPDERYHTGLILIMLLLCVSTFFFIVLFRKLRDSNERKYLHSFYPSST